MLTVSCDQCGKSIKKHPSALKRTQHSFCSKACQHAFHSEQAKTKVSLTCPVCNKAFFRFQSYISDQDENAILCCSETCRGVNQRRRVEKICSFCGNAFSLPESQKERQFCSRKCYEANRATAFITTTCKTCGKSFEIKASYEGRYTYCNEVCRKADQQPKLSGVYAIRNKVNSMVYIGSTTHIYRRWRSHESKLKMGTHENPNLQKDYNAHGIDNFAYEILELVPKDTLFDVEQKYLDDVLGRNVGYNVYPNADSPRDRKMSDEDKAHLSQMFKGRVFSDEHRQKLSATSKGRPKSPQTIEALRRANTGRVHSAEVRQAASKRNKGAGNANAKISEDDVRAIKKLLAQKVSAPKIAKLFPIATSQIYRIAKGESWADIT